MDLGAIRRRLTLGTAVLTASGLLALAGPAGEASAASPCAGRKVRTLPFSTGHVDVHKKRGYVCAVTYPKKVGARRYMMVSVQARGSERVPNAGRFVRYAGPVRVHAGHRCVRIKGAVGSGSVSTGWILC
ncbi:hypothetical protein GCM10010372_53600 [Streptomyces tauricus]|uniref:Secreted protein n=1 Tax=Streptomyces tauricus TaxID=68274 RepID=A0ABZ1JNL3_9ACTN|nr:MULTISPECIES: hypothetical protein [Streptomyces]MCW8098648.1 hypothetical protein [Streptomyces tauricus]UPZ31083.1 hypothetical protein MUK60_26930 [Streptomyces sp. LRE541]GHA47004.1 hypothetical protein GCM10010372_53600 [Streptomyces tauricus]